jgi:nicotinamidase-related amidase
MIKEFITGKLGNTRTQSVVPNIVKILDLAREQSIPIIYVTDSHTPSIDNEFKVWGPHAEANSEGAEIIPELTPKKGDVHLKKRRYSAFFETGLNALLHELKIDTLILIGVLTNICVQHSAADAYYRDYKIIILEDCVNALSDEEQKTSLGYMKRMYNAEITTLENLSFKVRVN